MRVTYLAPALLATTAVVSASASANANANAEPAVRTDITLIPVEGVSQEAVHLLVRRQLDLGGIIDGLKGLFDLLSPASLKNINLIITNLASVLNAVDVKQVRDLLELVEGLINSDAAGGLVDKLGDLLPTLLDLLNSDLLTKLTNILNNASILLTRDVAEQLNDLITSIGPLFNYLGEFIRFFLELLFGGGSSGGGGGSGSGGGSSTTTSPPSTVTDGPGSGSTTSPDDPDYSITLTGGSDSPSATETLGFDWWDSLGLGSSSSDDEEDDSDTSSSSDSSDSDSSWDLGFSNSGGDDDSELVTGGSDESEESAGDSEDPGFTGAAGRVVSSVRIRASGAVGALVAILLL